MLHSFLQNTPKRTMYKASSILIFLMAAAHSGAQLEKYTASNTDCAKKEFSKVLPNCCMNPYGSIFSVKTNAPVLKQCKGNAKMAEWINSYKINTLQLRGINNFIDVTNKNTVKELCKNGAFLECVFQANGWMDASGALNISSINDAFVSAANDTTWKSIVTSILEPMHPKNEGAYAFKDIVVDKFEKITCPTGTVNLLPLMMAQMLQSEFIWMCPQQNWLDWYSETLKCSDTMWAFKYCDGEIYSMEGRGVFYFPQV